MLATTLREKAHHALEVMRTEEHLGRAGRLWDLTRTPIPREDRNKGALVSKVFLKLADWYV